MKKVSEKFLVILMGTVLACVIITAPPVAAANKTNIAEVANELHPWPIHEVTRELQPDRVKPSSANYNGTLESIPGLNLSH